MYHDPTVSKRTSSGRRLPRLLLWLSFTLLSTFVYSQSIYLGDLPDAGAQCNCLNNATTLTDGQFLDTVTVNSGITGESWTVSVAMGAQANVAPFDPIMTGDDLTETSPGIYQLIIRHTDALGFSIQVTDGSTTLNISNLCYYPDVAFTSLPDTICLTSAPLALAPTVNTGGVAGSGSFTIDGTPATIFNPQTLGEGTYTVSYSFDADSGTPEDPTDPGCITTISKDVVVPPEPNVAVIALVNVNLGEDCVATITPDMVMSSMHPCMDDFIVTVFDQNGFPLGDVITGAQAGFRLDVRVMSAAGEFIGDGQIDVFDTDAPGITCPEADYRVDVTNDIQRLEATIPPTATTFVPNNFACYDDAVATMSGRHYYTLYEFTVDQMDVYTIELSMDLAGGGVFGLYQGPFQPFQGPCQGLVGVGEDLPPGEGFFVSDPNARRLHVMLVPGMPYTLLTTTFEGDQIADYTYAIYSEGNGRVTGLPSIPGTVELPLYCSSIPGLINNPASLTLLGEPVIDDPCNSDPAVTFVDALDNPNGNCGVATLTRTFTVRDAFDNSSSCTQIVEFPRITLEEVNLPPQTFNIPCDATFPTDPDGNPAPELTGYPFVVTAEGTFDLDPNYCNMLASYEDGPTIMVCSGTDQFTRTWTVFDDCNPAEIRTFRQLIIIGDRLGPIISCSAPDTDLDGLPDTLVYSTQSDECVASFNVPEPIITDNCSGWSYITEVVTDEQVPIRNPFGTIIGFTTEERTLAVIRPNDSRLVRNIPVGPHRIRYTATDECGNMSVGECPIRVEDLAAPAALCDDQINVSIGGNGRGNVMAEDIDEGSTDNCGPVVLEIRRIIDFDPDDCQVPAPPVYTPWGPDIDLYCCEAGSTIEAELLVTDINGFSNTCSTNIVILDNTAPTCVAPQPVVTTCADLPMDFNFEDISLLQANFGMAEVDDICGDGQITELAPIVNMERCGIGSVLRRFQAQDPSGNINSCQQLIQINSNTNYLIKFPKDVTGECAMPGVDTLELYNFGCDEFMVRSTDERFDAVGDGACYKILRTYEVINWCEYDGFSEPVEISRNLACLPQGGMQDVWVTRLPDGRAFYDADDDPFNNFPAANSRGSDCGAPNPSGYWERVNSNGYWTYTQLIKVTDTDDPEINVNTPEPFCSTNEACTAPASISFTVNDGCATTLSNIAAAIDVNTTGVFGQSVNVTGSFPNFQVGGVFPIGQHRARLTVSDNCGNSTTAFVDFSVVDCKAVGLMCASNITINLMPQPPGVDADGDGEIDVAAAAVNVGNFILSVTEDCTGPIRYTIHRSEDVDSGDDVPFPDRPALVVTCDDVGPLPVRIYAWDSANNPYAEQPDGTIGGPNFATCNATLTVADNMNLCEPGTGMGNLTGLIMTENGEPVSGVEVSPRDDMMEAMTMTEEDGLFDFNLQTSEDYQVTPYSGSDFDNGVTTFDIILVSKHVLGVQALDSPYKLIAADVNHSGSISTLDIIHMRKTILGIYSEFPDNNSWRFVPADYRFPDPTDPWAEVFPEALVVPQFGGSVQDADFIAVKIGDVNGSARANWLESPEGRALDNPYYLRTDELSFTAGETVEAIFSSANTDDWVQGFQFTLQFDPQVLAWEQLEEGLLSGQHINTARADQGLLTISWDAGTDMEKQGEYSFFGLRFYAEKPGRLSEVIGITSRITKAEAYGLDDSLRGVALNFAPVARDGEAFFLEQNRPNPFGDQTIIGFQIPESGTVTLSIYDTNGKTIRQYQQFFSAGYNQFLVDAQDIAARGLLYYQLETDRYAATKKMVILDR